MAKQRSYNEVTGILHDHNIMTAPAEIQGTLCGLLCGGMGHSDDLWMKVLSESYHQEQPFSPPVEALLTDLFNQVCQEFIEGQFSLNLLLPDDDEPINVRGLALIDWVQGFLAGFGMQQNDLSKCSAEVQEALTDFTDIARMEEPMEDDEESERALEEVIEYVRISAIYTFNELGKSLLDDTPSPPSLH